MKFDEISIEGRASIRQEYLLKDIKSNFEKLRLRNIESLQQIILAIQELLDIVEDNSYLVIEVKM